MASSTQLHPPLKEHLLTESNDKSRPLIFECCFSFILILYYPWFDVIFVLRNSVPNQHKHGFRRQKFRRIPRFSKSERNRWACPSPPAPCRWAPSWPWWPTSLWCGPTDYSANLFNISSNVTKKCFSLYVFQLEPYLGLHLKIRDTLIRWTSVQI